MSPSLVWIKATRWPEGFKFWRRERNKIATFAVMYHVHVNSFPVCDGTELRHNRGGGEASKYKIQRVPKIKIQKLFEFLKKFWNSRKIFWCPKLPRNTSLWEVIILVYFANYYSWVRLLSIKSNDKRYGFGTKIQIFLICKKCKIFHTVKYFTVNREIEIFSKNSNNFRCRDWFENIGNFWL